MSIEQDVFSLVSGVVNGGAFAAYGITSDADVAWPAVTFDPENRSYWLEVMVIRGDGQDTGMADDAGYMENGTIRIVATSRPSGGIISLVDLAELVAVSIPKGAQLGAAFISKTPILLSIINEGSTLMQPISYTYSR